MRGAITCSPRGAAYGNPVEIVPFFFKITDRHTNDVPVCDWKWRNADARILVNRDSDGRINCSLKKDSKRLTSMPPYVVHTWSITAADLVDKCSFCVIKILFHTLINSPAGTVAKYCNERVCVFVCLFAIIFPEPLAIFTDCFVHVAIATARSPSGGVVQSQGEGTILGVFFPIDNASHEPYSGMNFATKNRFRA